MTRRTVVVLTGLLPVLLLVGWAILADGSGQTREKADDAKKQAASTLTLKDVATDATDPDDLADYEPSIAVNPKDPKEIAILTFSGGWDPDDRQLMSPVWRSTDGGQRWRKVHQIPYPEQGRAGPGDQAVAFDQDGKLVVAAMASGPRPCCFLYREGARPTGPLIPGKAYGDDQPLLAIDVALRSPCFKGTYSPWLDLKKDKNAQKEKHASMVTVSADRGRTHQYVAVAGDTSAHNRTTRLAVGPRGAVYVVYKVRGKAVGEYEDAHFCVRRSDDCGKTWGGLGKDGISVHGANAVTTHFTRRFGNPRKGKVATARSSDAWIAVNGNTGSVFVAYVHKDASGYSQIYVARSGDKGKTWAATRVTDGKHHAGYPEIAAADNGTVGVLYVDYDDSGLKTLFRHHFARSFDGGKSWSNQQLQQMDPSDIANAVNGILWGDYEGLTASGNTFFGVFTGESNGRTVRQLDPIFFTETAEKPQK